VADAGSAPAARYRRLIFVYTTASLKASFMHITFGLSLDAAMLPSATSPEAGRLWLGPRGLLLLLEERLGLSHLPLDIDFLRIEQYRQLLLTYASSEQAAFFRASLEADSLATAEVILAHRDELRAAGWDFSVVPDMPPRLRQLAEVEMLQVVGQFVGMGVGDRWQGVLQAIRQGRRHGLAVIDCIEPPALLPPVILAACRALEAAGVVVRQCQQPVLLAEDSDLARWQRQLLSGEKSDNRRLAADGSLLLLRGSRDLQLSAFMATMLRKNPAFRPAFVQPDYLLDDALDREGLPVLGIPSASPARPALQVLKLVTVFLWDPIDINKVMEFVSLSVKPLDDGLARRISAYLSKVPGLFADSWFMMINGYFEEQQSRGLETGDVRRQYDFWFRRNRVDIVSDRVTTLQARDIYAFLQQWALSSYEPGSAAGSSWLTLAAQAGRIVALLEMLPEDRLSFLELERIVRTIYASVPVTHRAASRGRADYAAEAGGVVGSVDKLIWWNFVQAEPDYFFARWYPGELAWLQARSVSIELPATQNNRMAWLRKQPLRMLRQQLILCLPETVSGTTTQPHPLYGDLKASFDNLEAITADLDARQFPDSWLQQFSLPAYTPGHYWPLGQPQPFLQVRPLQLREEETPSSLNSLLYYPHQWFFRHHIRLRSTGILTVTEGNTLLGNLAHRFMEILFQEPWQQLDKPALERWVDEKAPALFSKEGASLLLYGREPERVAFIKRIKQAAWKLIRFLVDNGWADASTEVALKGVFEGVPLNGRADMLLARGGEQAIVDLKWSGKTRFMEMLKNKEDIQLALYAALSANGRVLPHTAYFILDSGSLLAYNNEAFREATLPGREAFDHQEIYGELLARTGRTLQWRLSQLQAGKIEVRCLQTHSQLEQYYSEELLDLLEMKKDSAAFDDYQILIQAL